PRPWAPCTRRWCRPYSPSASCASPRLLTTPVKRRVTSPRARASARRHAVRRGCPRPENAASVQDEASAGRTPAALGRRAAASATPGAPVRQALVGSLVRDGEDDDAGAGALAQRERDAVAGRQVK